jgi:cathepsin F
MKRVIIALVLVGLALAATREDFRALTEFKKFMAANNKSYSNEEMRSRFQIFKSNLALIDNLNAQSKHAKFGVTKFADMSPEEFKALYLGTKPFKPQADWPMLPLKSEQELKDIPQDWDWRTKGAVTPVKNQGQCGSCWSFSTTGNVEGQWFLAGNPLTSLSEQNLVDCDKECMTYQGQQVCDAGCEGGLMPNAFTYIIKNNGIDTEDSYPYEGIDDTCRFSATNVGAKISNWTMVPGQEDQMAAYLYSTGPLSIAVDATWWQFYIEGVFDFPWCGSTLDHGVLIVGYAYGPDLFDQNINYWIIKNSWGADWGESGYIRVYKGDDQCGLNLFPCTSLITK